MKKFNLLLGLTIVVFLLSKLNTGVYVAKEMGNILIDTSHIHNFIGKSIVNCLDFESCAIILPAGTEIKIQIIKPIRRRSRIYMQCGIHIAAYIGKQIEEEQKKLGGWYNISGPGDINGTIASFLTANKFDIPSTFGYKGTEPLPIWSWRIWLKDSGNPDAIIKGMGWANQDGEVPQTKNIYWEAKIRG